MSKTLENEDVSSVCLIIHHIFCVTKYSNSFFMYVQFIHMSLIILARSTDTPLLVRSSSDSALSPQATETEASGSEDRIAMVRTTKKVVFS